MRLQRRRRNCCQIYSPFWLVVGRFSACDLCLFANTLDLISVASSPDDWHASERKGALEWALGLLLASAGAAHRLLGYQVHIAIRMSYK